MLVQFRLLTYPGSESKILWKVRRLALMVLANLFAKAQHRTNKGNWRSPGGIATYSAIIRFVCNMSFDFHCACSNATTFKQFRSFLHITLSSTFSVDPILDVYVGIIASMDQTIMPRTYHWLQRTCIRRNESSMRRINTFQMGRVTQVHAHPQGCEDRGNEGGANVVLSWSNYT